MKWGKLRPTIPSRFLYELSGKADNPAQVGALGQCQEEGRAIGENIERRRNKAEGECQDQEELMILAIAQPAYAEHQPHNGNTNLRDQQ